MRRTLKQHLFDPGPKRILSLDGGGVRGLITLGMLQQVEDVLKQRSGKGDDFRLSDYFDLIGGTSTGALIATLLALGETVEDIKKLYMRMCPRIFKKGSWFTGLKSKFDSNAFDAIVAEEFKKVLRDSGVNPDKEPSMDTHLLRTGIALVTKRVDSDAVWVLTNNPKNKFWDRNSEPWNDYWAKPEHSEIQFYPNRDYLLRKVAQASASAPFYFDPIEFKISDNEQGLFFDGGASPNNNPSSELFLMSTLKSFSEDKTIPRHSPHGFGWQTGADNLYMLSLGTGTWRERVGVKEFNSKVALKKAIHALRGIISDAETANVVLMQALSENEPGYYVNLNLGDMNGLRIVEDPLLSFHRVNVVLDRNWLSQNLGNEFDYSDVILSKLKQLDLPEKANLNRCFEVGLQTGQKFISDKMFPERFNI